MVKENKLYINKDKINKKKFRNKVYSTCILSNRCDLLEFREDEVHVKIGGDHGGKSFKACYEICNIPRPNSKDNTVIFSLFEAKDYRTNLRAGLLKFQEEVDNLQTSRWQ